MELFPSLGEETRLPPPQGVSQIQMGIVLETIIDIMTMQDHCCFHTLKHRLVIEIGRWSIIPISRDN